MALAAFPVKRVQEPAPVTNIYEITPLNWRRYPSVPITAAMLAKTDAAAKAVTYNGGVANLGAGAPNSGEVGTVSSTTIGRGQGWVTQAEKAVVLGTTMAVDVGKHYNAARGKIEPFEPYVTGLTVSTPAAYQTTQQASWDLT